MASLLIANISRGKVEKGDVIEVRHHIGPGGGEPITQTELQQNCLVKVPDKLMSELDPYQAEWNLDVDYEVVAHQVPVDGYRVRVFSSQTSSTLGHLTRQQVEIYLNGWNATVFSTAQNEVVFDFLIFDLVKSQSYWESKVDASRIVWNEISYDEVTGIHRVSADYSALGNNPAFIERYVAKRFDMDKTGQTQIINHDDRIIVFEITRIAALTFFKWEVSARVKTLVKKRRWRLASAAVDSIVAQGGIVTENWAAVQSYLEDKWQTT